MNNEPKGTNEVLPGTIFEWRKPGNTRVARYRVDGGQLLWMTESVPLREFAVAIVVDGKPVEVTSAQERDQKPRRLRLEWRPIGSTAGDLVAEVELAALFECFLEGSERIVATRVE